MSLYEKFKGTRTSTFVPMARPSLPQVDDLMRNFGVVVFVEELEVLQRLADECGKLQKGFVRRFRLFENDGRYGIKDIKGEERVHLVVDNLELQVGNLVTHLLLPLQLNELQLPNHPDEEVECEEYGEVDEEAEWMESRRVKFCMGMGAPPASRMTIWWLMALGV